MPAAHTKAARSNNMRAIKSSGNKSTEQRIIILFKKNRITRWRRHPNLKGKPDFIFPHQRIALFVDGCFWHGCKKHFKTPNTNRRFWMHKIRGNKKRDKVVSSDLRKSGWKVIRIWEHQVKKQLPAHIFREFSK